jgi:hypothetical protein
VEVEIWVEWVDMLIAEASGVFSEVVWLLMWGFASEVKELGAMGGNGS